MSVISPSFGPGQGRRQFLPRDDLPRETDPSAVLTSQVRTAQIALLFRNAPASLVGNILTAALALLVLAPALPTAASVVWGVCMLGAALARLSTLLAWRRADTAARQAADWGRRMMVAVSCMGICWGTAGALLFATGNPGQLTFTALVLGGLVAGSVATLGPVRGAYLAFSLPIMALMIGGILWRGDSQSQVIAGLFLVFELAMIASVAQVNKLFRGNIRQRLEKERLAWSLAGTARRLHQTNDDLLHEIAERKAVEKKVEDLAFFDPLTRLPNRRLLLDRMRQAMAGSARGGRSGAVLFVDLDNFKIVNDTRGHDAGDRVLIEVAQGLRTCVRDSDTVARLGGDEFVILLENLDEDPVDAAIQAKSVGEKIVRALNGAGASADAYPRVVASIGVATFSGSGIPAEELLKQADIAMYQAKTAGRNTMRFFDPEMQVSLAARTALEAAMRSGLQHGEFVLHYQPQVDSDHRIVGAEALLRWDRPGHGQVSPGDFIALAEETGLILPLGHWVLESACRQLVAWAAGEETRHIVVAVNVSARQFRQPHFVSQVMQVLGRTGADPRKLKLELTESMLLDNVDDVIAKMTALKARGLSFSLDDFGTGYSSLSYLKRLPLDQVKIDQSFVRDLLEDQNSAAIVQTIIALGRTMGMSVIAEGVETSDQRALLDALGCSTFQGYLFGRPVSVAAFDALMREWPEKQKGSGTEVA